MKKILFFSYVFYPDNEIGAVRVSELVQRLSEEYECYVVVSNRSKKSEREHIHFIYINDCNHSETYTQKTDNKKRANKNQKKFGNNSIRECLFQFKLMFKEYKYYRRFKKEYLSSSNIKFDYILFTYNPLCNLFCGLMTKKKYPQTPLIADFRDPIDVPLVPKINRFVYRMIQNAACKRADLIIPVSYGYENKIVRKKYLDKSHVITNGFSYIRKADLIPKKFSFLYIGSTYDGKRDFSPLFCAIKKLLDENRIDKSDIVIEYAGKDYLGFEKYINEFNLNDYYSYLGTLSRDECYQKETESFYLILSTWNTSDYQGVIPGKLYEYMASGRKILSVCTGNKEGSEAGKMIMEHQLGYAIEINYDLDHLCNYIFNDYISFKNGVYKYNPKDINNYSYDIIAKRYIEEINKLGE